MSASAFPPLSRCHAFRSQAFAGAFQGLSLGATLKDESGWYAIFTPPDIIVAFEYAHGLAPERYAYNADSVGRVERGGKTLIGQHAGFHDFFVPVAHDPARVEAVLITGPFAPKRPTARDVKERWRSLTGREGHLSDPEFSYYLSSVLGVLTLDRQLRDNCQRLLECYALLMAERGDAARLASEAQALRRELERARATERAWDAARTMVDERVAPQWLSPHSNNDLSALGVPRLPEHVVVGLCVAAKRDLDPVEELLQRDAFQRACVEVGRARRVIAGRVSEHGVTFLIPGARSPARLEALIQTLTEDAARVGRRLGLRLHWGASALTGSGELPLRYEHALGAAEQALSQGRSLVRAGVDAPGRLSAIRERRRRLTLTGEERPAALRARFEQYVQAVSEQCGYRFEAVAAHLLAGFDHVAQSLLAGGALSEKSYLDTCEGLDRAARQAVTLGELIAAYQRAVGDLVTLIERPARAAQDRNLNRAIAFVHRHFTERIRSSQVARVAGFAPGYFAQLFKRRERMTFDRYLRQLRIERAKHLLRSTKLSAERVSKLSGFVYRPYFCRVFKQSEGLTPHEYRRRRRY